MLNYMDLANQAATAFKAHDRERAVTIIGQLVHCNADLGQNWGGLARIATTFGEATLAIEAARFYAEVNPADPQRQLSRAAIMAEVGKVKESATLIKSFARKAPQNAALHHFLGTAQSQLGETKSAIKNLRRALKTRETSGQTWLTLAALKRFTSKDPDLLQLQSLQDVMSCTAPQEQASYLYALGKALDDTDQTEMAFAAYAKGARLMQQIVSYNPGLNQNFVQNAIEDFNNDNTHSFKTSNVTDNRPIFVMGWPRTGTTLVEQILSSHSAVTGGGELNLFGTASSALKGSTFKHAQFYEQNFIGNKNPWSHIADIYLHLLTERFGTEGRIIDKSLNNGRFLGLIHHIFPQSPIIWMRRNPADTAWSCFKTFFNKSLEWSWSFENIAHHFNLEDQLLKHWVTQFPEKILQVPYEQLVRNPDIWIPKILAHCNLDVEKNVYAFHKTKRTIITASVEQVRRPMTQTSINSSDRYMQHITPFLSNYKK